MKTSGHYHVSGDKMNEVFDLIRDYHGAKDHEIDILAITDFCCADWPEGEEHQAWLDTAPAQEIADWLIAAGPQAYGLVPIQ